MAPSHRIGVKITLSEWRHPQPGAAEANVELTLFLTVGLEGREEELVFDIAAQERATFEDGMAATVDWDAQTVQIHPE